MRRRLVRRRSDQLAADVGDREHQQPADSVRIRQHVVGGVAAVAGAIEQRAEGEGRLGAVAGEHVRARGTAVDEQAVAVGLAPLDRRSIAGTVRREDLAELLVVPAECRHVVVVAVQDAGLTGAGLGGEIALPPDDVVCSGPDPSGECRGATFADRPSEYRFGEPVDLEEEDAGHVGRRRRFETFDHALHRLSLPHRIVVDRQQRADGDSYGGHQQRREHRPAGAVDAEPVEHRLDQQQDQTVGDESQDSSGPQDQT
jgi:hypothetical protein